MLVVRCLKPQYHSFLCNAGNGAVSLASCGPVVAYAADLAVLGKSVLLLSDYNFFRCVHCMCVCHCVWVFVYVYGYVCIYVYVCVDFR